MSALSPMHSSRNRLVPICRPGSGYSEMAYRGKAGAFLVTNSQSRVTSRLPFIRTKRESLVFSHGWLLPLQLLLYVLHEEVAELPSQLFLHHGAFVRKRQIGPRSGVKLGPLRKAWPIRISRPGEIGKVSLHRIRNLTIGSLVLGFVEFPKHVRDILPVGVPVSVERWGMVDLIFKRTIPGRGMPDQLLYGRAAEADV